MIIARRHIQNRVDNNDDLESKQIRFVRYDKGDKWIKVDSFFERFGWRYRIWWDQVSEIKTISTGVARSREIVGDALLPVGFASGFLFLLLPLAIFSSKKNQMHYADIFADWFQYC